MNQHMSVEPVPFIDIGAQRRRLGRSIDEAVSRVLTHCQFINGPEVTQLEAALDAPRALMMAAPRCCTDEMNSPLSQASSLITLVAGWPLIFAWVKSGYCVAE